MFDRILVVCTGNICRSPVAAAMLRQRLPHKRIECAGLGALEGHGVDKTAGELAAEEKLNLAEHKARQITGEMLQEADLVLVMTESQRRAIAEKHPAVMGKVMLYGQWLTNPETRVQGIEIPDPYRKSREAFAQVHKLLNQAAESWQKKL